MPDRKATVGKKTISRVRKVNHDQRISYNAIGVVVLTAAVSVIVRHDTSRSQSVVSDFGRHSQDDTENRGELGDRTGNIIALPLYDWVMESGRMIVAE